MEKNRPKVGMGVYIVNDKHQLLLTLRKGEHAGGTWCPPGGHLENGESFFDCAKRETEEEVGMIINDVEILGVVNNIFSPDKHYVNVDVLAKGVSGKPQIMEPDKCEKIEWFDLDSLPENLLMLPAHNLFEQYPEIRSRLSNFNSFE